MNSHYKTLSAAAEAAAVPDPALSQEAEKKAIEEAKSLLKRTSALCFTLWNAIIKKNEEATKKIVSFLMNPESERGQYEEPLLKSSLTWKQRAGVLASVVPLSISLYKLMNLIIKRGVSKEIELGKIGYGFSTLATLYILHKYINRPESREPKELSEYTAYLNTQQNLQSEQAKLPFSAKNIDNPETFPIQLDILAQSKEFEHFATSFILYRPIINKIVNYLFERPFFQGEDGAGWRESLRLLLENLDNAATSKIFVCALTQCVHKAAAKQNIEKKTLQNCDLQKSADIKDDFNKEAYLSLTYQSKIVNWLCFYRASNNDPEFFRVLMAAGLMLAEYYKNFAKPQAQKDAEESPEEKKWREEKYWERAYDWSRIRSEWARKERAKERRNPRSQKEDAAAQDFKKQENEKEYLTRGLEGPAKDYVENLDKDKISEIASFFEKPNRIKYRSLVLKHHPDHSHTNDSAGIFQKIKEKWDKAKRFQKEDIPSRSPEEMYPGFSRL